MLDFAASYQQIEDFFPDPREIPQLPRQVSVSKGFAHGQKFLNVLTLDLQCQVDCERLLQCDRPRLRRLRALAN